MPRGQHTGLPESTIRQARTNLNARSKGRSAPRNVPLKMPVPTPRPMLVSTRGRLGGPNRLRIDILPA
jgi:hypothetical protein